MAFYGLIWSFMVFYGHIIVFYGRSWQNIDLIGLVSSFLAVIDHSFGLVFALSCSTKFKFHEQGHFEPFFQALDLHRWAFNAFAAAVAIAHFGIAWGAQFTIVPHQTAWQLLFLLTLPFTPTFSSPSPISPSILLQ